MFDSRKPGEGKSHRRRTRAPLITSGLDGVYPKGINVGRVIKVRELKESLFQEILVQPFTDFRRLEEVFVVVADGR